MLIDIHISNNPNSLSTDYRLRFKTNITDSYISSCLKIFWFLICLGMFVLIQANDADEKVVDLKNKLRVLCWIMTEPSNHKAKAIHVKATWGKRCNTLLFMSSVSDYELPAVAVVHKEGRNLLWNKTKNAFKFIYEYHNDEYDWVLKADDDTYVIMENLRHFLKDYHPNNPIYFGCKFKPFVKQGYMSGGAGYVLSKEAVKRLVTEALPNRGCKQGDESFAEDVELGLCLQLVNVRAGDSRDKYGKERFFALNPKHHLYVENNRNYGQWIYRYLYYHMKEGLDYCCSDTAISFHYTAPQDMYLYEYMLYKLKIRQ